MTSINLVNSSGTSIMDSVAIDYEDSFSLDSFETLIYEHENCEPKFRKHFIIARVHTWDPRQPGKEYFSYYSAYGLNKILFQTQTYLGKRLIHRIHVMNPLTNTDIVGAVEYFIVRRRQGALMNKGIDDTFNPEWGILQATKNWISSASKPIITSLGYTNKKRLSTHEDMKIMVQEHTILEEDETSSIISRNSNSPLSLNSAKSPLRVTTSFFKSDLLNKDIPPSPSVLNAENGKAQWTIGDQAVSIYKEEVAAESKYAKNVPTHISNKPKSPNPLTIDVSKSPVVLKVNIPFGKSTRYTKPVSASDVASTGINLAELPSRNLSYGNSKATTPTMTFDDWNQQDKQRQVQNKNESNSPYKIASPLSPAISAISFRNSTKKDGKNKDLGLNKKVIVSASATLSDGNETKNENNIEWEAILFATDIDYLEQSHIRQIFRENAISATDYKHFDMKAVIRPVEVSDDLGPYGREVLLLQNNKSLRDRIVEWCYPTKEEALSLGYGSFMTYIHRYKCYIIPLLVFTGVTIVIIIMAIDNNDKTSAPPARH